MRRQKRVTYIFKSCSVMHNINNNNSTNDKDKDQGSNSFNNRNLKRNYEYNCITIELYMLK